MKYLNIKKALTAWQNLQPLSEKDRERLSRRFTVDFNYNSNHIEGNTLTYGQTEILLLFGKVGAHADIKDIRPFLKYFNDLVATEVYNDVLFVSKRNENVWWYDGEQIAFRTHNYTKILNAMRTQPTLTLADMKEETGISVTAIQKLLDQLISKKYVERGEKDGSWRVFVTQ